MRWLRSRVLPVVAQIRLRLRSLFRRADVERELDDELRFHIEMETEKNVRQGLEPQEARRRAMIAFGGVERHKEASRDARGTRPLEDGFRDFRFALRRLARDPGYAVPTVATIGIGIGITAAVFVLVNAVLLRPLPYPEADRLVEIRHVAPRTELAVTGLSPGIFVHYRKGNRSLEEVAFYQASERTLTDLGGPEQVRAALVSPSLFTVLRATPYKGSFPGTAEFDSGSRTGVLISYDLWVRRYGADPEIIGRRIELNRQRHVVVGVADPGFHFPHPETQLWISGEDLVTRFGWGSGVRSLFLSGIARLRPGVSPEEAERDLDRLVRTLPEAFPDVTAEQLEEMGLRTEVGPFKDVIVGDVRVALLLLLGTAGFLLLITWANATNLSLVRGERQRREVAVERALGASDGRLARRFLSESLLVAVLGGTLGLGLAYAAVRVRFGFGPEQIPRLREVAMGGAGLGLTLGLVVLTAVLLAAVSLASARRRGDTGPLAGGLAHSTVGRKEQSRRRLLVAGQVALALTLLIGSALMARSYWRLTEVDLGFDPEGALTFFLPMPQSEYREYPDMARLHHEVLRRVRSLPGVEAAEAATVTGFPLTPVPDYYVIRVAAADAPAADSAGRPLALHGFATPGYFRAMGIPLLRGRGFEATDANRNVPPVILSARLAGVLFGTENPIGQLVGSRGTAYTVVGVVGNVPGRTVREGPSMALYFPNIHPAPPNTGGLEVPVYPINEQYVVRTSLPPTSLVPAIRRSIREVDPKLPMLRVGTLEGLVDDSMARARITMMLLAVGAGTALFLGVIGIYGVLAYTVRRRTSELGIRIALGARPDQIVRMVLRQGALIALGGIVAGVAAAWALTRSLGSLLYEVSPSDPLTFVAMALLLLTVALAASYLPARRAGRIDPVRAFKVE